MKTLAKTIILKGFDTVVKIPTPKKETRLHLIPHFRFASAETSLLSIRHLSPILSKIRMMSLSFLTPLTIPHHDYFPYLRFRPFEYDRITFNRSSLVISGHVLSMKNNSEYADCHNKKLLRRISPEVRKIMSGSTKLSNVCSLSPFSSPDLGRRE
mmetsp:Transcript_4455/g.6519  ORF Transcript_4455/g.6519 Transcript_4455/m.6519 type:complete len:155 (-) Transcript_4455:453-917(-)